MRSLFETSLSRSLLRQRNGSRAQVTFEELFFDLVYVFAVTQLSHRLLHNLTAVSVLQTMILWFAVWLGWQYTCWSTNWFDPETPRIRGLLFATMLLGLFMASSIPQAFGDRGMVFASTYVAMQVGCIAFINLHLSADHPLAPNYRRMLVWVTIAAVFWIAGAIAQDTFRVALWLVAVLCEYFSPMIGFAVPGLGRSRTRDWTIEGGHLAERCQLFVIFALGETVLASGATLSEVQHWDVGVISALISTFVSTLAMWWLYFGTSSKDASATIARSEDPGRIGAYFHYVHVVLVAGIIATAVGNDLVLADPLVQPSVAQVAMLIAGPAIYLLGSGVYKAVVYGGMAAWHIGGALMLLVLVPAAFIGNMLTTSWLTTGLLLIVGIQEGYMLRRPRPEPR